MNNPLRYSATEVGIPASRFIRPQQTLGYGAIVRSNAPTTVVFNAPPQPAVVPIPDRSGRSQNTYKDIFFGYVKYSLEAFEFGAIPEDKIIDLYVWNARLEGQPPVNVTSVIPPEDTSVELLLPETPPYLFVPMEEQIYRLTARAVGEPNIDNILVINYDTEPTNIIPVTGLRIVVFKYSPDWSDRVIQTYTWNTNVIQSRDGKEQRVKLREFPRMALEYSLLVEDGDARTLSSLLMSWADKPFAVPLWMDVVHTTGIAVVGQPAIQLVGVEGTSVEYATLFYVPFTGLLHTLVSTALLLNPSGEGGLTDDYPRVAALLVDVTYQLPESTDVSRFTVTGALAIDAYIRLYDFEDTLIHNVPTDVVLTTDDIFDVTGSVIRMELYTGQGTPPAGGYQITVDPYTTTFELTTGSDLPVNIPSGSALYPCEISHVTKLEDYVAHHSALKGLSIGFNSLVMGAFPSAEDQPDYKGLLVQETSPTWNEGQRQDITNNLVVHDYKSGLIGTALSTDYIGSKVERNDIVTNSEEITNFKEEIQRRAGRYLPYWLPTFTQDLIIVVPVGLIDDFIIVEPQNNVLLYKRTRDYKDIRIVLFDGTIIYREIVGASIDGTNERLDLNDNLGGEYAVSEFRIISYMSKVRAEFDSVTMSWETNKMATIAQTFRGVDQ